MKYVPYMAKAILEDIGKGSLPDWHLVDSLVRVKHLNVGDCLFRADEQNPYVYFIGQGVIKMVYETVDGKEWIKAFAEEGRFFASLTALAPRGKTSFSAYAAWNAFIE